MALRICSWKCLFSVFLLHSAISWEATAATHYHPIKRALSAENANPVEGSTEDPSLDVTLPPNITNKVTDHHTYYNSTFYSNPDEAMSFWVNLSQIPDEKVITHDTLSSSHRRAAGITLCFDFPFYGHLMRNITIATGGFLYMGDHIHSWIAATQYIAPLMANFDPSLAGESTIQYHDNGTALTVQWDKVLLQDRNNDGSFTFQTTLLQNGDIIFVYKEIPFPILEISNESHPVKVGCSDAYVMERTTIVFRKKIIYEYHRLDQKYQEISNKTAIVLTSLPTCLKLKDCNSCMNADIGFNCSWCEAVGKCSDGLDRSRQEWLRQKCHEVDDDNCPAVQPTANPPVVVSPSETSLDNVTSNASSVPSVDIKSTNFTTESPNITAPDATIPTSNPFPSPSSSGSQATDSPSSGSRKQSRKEKASSEDSGIGAGGIFAIVLIVILALGLGIWAFYAYRNPQSSSGQFLIKYRPSQWHWKSEESRYSASVHM